MTGFVRKVLTGCDSDNVKVWNPSFMKRLKISWRGKHSLTFDATVYKAVHKIAGRRIVVSIEPINEDALKIVLVDLVISQRFIAGNIAVDIVEIWF